MNITELSSAQLRQAADIQEKLEAITTGGNIIPSAMPVDRAASTGRPSRIPFAV